MNPRWGGFQESLKEIGILNEPCQSCFNWEYVLMRCWRFKLHSLYPILLLKKKPRICLISSLLSLNGWFKCKLHWRIWTRLITYMNVLNMFNIKRKQIIEKFSIKSQFLDWIRWETFKLRKLFSDGLAAILYNIITSSFRDKRVII
jgi:hypothetical protein